jgi:hypothetical protein
MAQVDPIYQETKDVGPICLRVPRSMVVELTIDEEINCRFHSETNHEDPVNYGKSSKSSIWMIVNYSKS